MTIERGMNPFPKKVAYVTHANEEEIAQIGGYENIVRRFMFMKFFERGPWFVCRPVSIVFVCTKTKLKMVGRNELF